MGPASASVAEGDDHQEGHSVVEKAWTVPRGQLPRHTARRIMSDLIDLDLRPGDSLADENTLQKHYDVARSTLRESLRLLTFLGAIKVQVGRSGGPRVAIPEPIVVGSALGMVVQSRGATLRTVFEARLAVEPAVAAMAANHRDERDLLVLDGSVTALQSAQQRVGPEFAEHAIAYTLRIGEAAHNPVLGAVVPALAAMTSAVPWRYPPGVRAELAEGVTATVEAIRRGNGTCAGAATREMLELLVVRLQVDQPSALNSPIRWSEVDETLHASH
ncbi:FadR/GntR family transcriptional regulator [Rhodococcus artemisiae]|uniref:FCD domain-containing protein n=1 Tax=Rhodococcus artemisiae TaxID=714159 RepID=A0ABU7LBW4_9NOCA|nr:FCD domain-containing protein [Rhodococcus artemisiae]MEE2059014.1 FCD domain-containing protein [Rhodococcus artemisiae]